MRLGVRGKLLLGSLGVIAISVFAADAYLARRLDDELTARIRRDLVVRLRLVARAAETLPADAPPGAWDVLADDLGARAAGRVTLIALDGTVQGDSDVPAGDIAQLDNHRLRPEVADALAHGQGDSVRASNTVGRRLLYVAVPFRRGGRVAGVARLAESLADIDRAVGDLRRILLVGLVLALGIAVVMTSGAAHLMSRAVRQLTAAARRMAGGDLAVRTHVGGRDELGELGRSLDALAAGLSRERADLRSERDLLGRILESMHEGVLVLDAERRVVLVNPALRDALALPAEVVGKTPLELVRNADLQALLERTAAGTPQAGEIAVGGPSPRRFLVNAAPLGGGIAGLVAVVVDVTEMRRLETVRRDFVANVSHELRTPIASVLSAAETLQAGALADRAAADRFVDIIARNADRLRALVDDLLELSRIESGHYPLERAPLDAPAVIEHVLGLFRERADRRGVRLLGEPRATRRPLADRRAVEQILVNLVDNAIKYGAPGGAIVVATRDEGDHLALTVTDDGPGIEPQHLPRLFERFYRVDPGRARETGGTGLGLSIVKHFAEAMGGSASVASTPARSTAFTVRLPAEPEPVSSSRP